MAKYYKKKSITKDGEVIEESTFEFYIPFREGVGYNLKYQSSYVKNYLSVGLPFVEEGKEGFTEIELGRIYRISRMMYSNSNLLAKRSNNQIVPITRDEIQDMLKMHRTKFVPFWKKILSFRILKPLKYDIGTFFCMNPLYYNSTVYLPLEIFLAFQSDLQAHIPKWAVDKYKSMEKEFVIASVKKFKQKMEEQQEPEKVKVNDVKNPIKEKIKEIVNQNKEGGKENE
jgi:hypothetical protein